MAETLGAALAVVAFADQCLKLAHHNIRSCALAG